MQKLKSLRVKLSFFRITFRQIYCLCLNFWKISPNEIQENYKRSHVKAKNVDIVIYCLSVCFFFFGGWGWALAPSKTYCTVLKCSFAIMYTDDGGCTVSNGGKRGPSVGQDWTSPRFNETIGRFRNFFPCPARRTKNHSRQPRLYK